MRILLASGALLASCAVAAAQPVVPTCPFPASSLDCITPDSVPFFGAALGYPASGVVFLVPAGASVASIRMINTTANAVTGGVSIGTTASGTDVVNACTVGANATVICTLAATGPFSATAATPLFVSSSNWNSAVVNLRVNYRQGP